MASGAPAYVPANRRAHFALPLLLWVLEGWLSDCRCRVCHGLSFAGATSRATADTSPNGTATTCSAGKLSPPGGQFCVPKPCAFSAPANSILGAGCPSGTLLHGGSCTLSCNSGYTPAGTTILCQAGSLVQTMSCAPAACTIATPVNGLRNTCPASLQSNQTCSFACKPGYGLSGPATIVCNGGTPSGTQTCVALGCTVPVPENGGLGGTYCPSGPGALAHGTGCTIGCNFGYTASPAGAAATFCNLGSLSTTQTCRPNDCTISQPPSGTLGTCGTGATATIASGTSCAFTCNTGYTLTGDATSCSLGAPVVQSCVAKTCTVPQPVNALPLQAACTAAPGGKLGHTSSCLVQCNPNFTPASTSVSCNAGTLTPPTVTCTGLPCALSAPGGGSLNSCPSSLPHGQSCSFSCNIGFSLVGTATTCTAGTPNLQQCLASSCSVIAPANGAANSTVPGECSPNIAPGATCMVTCNPGYTPSPLPMTCGTGSSAGVLTVVQTCVPNACSTAGLAPAVVGSLGSCPAGLLAHGASCSIACNTGYTVVGAARTCIAGTLTGTAQTCSPNPCSVTAPVGGSLSACPSSLPSGQTCEFSCNTGYQLGPLVPGPPPLTVSCTAGQLATPLQTCEPLSCPIECACGRQPAWWHLLRHGEPTHGSSCSIKCNTGYTMVGAQTTCVAGTLTATQSCAGQSCTVTAPTGATMGTCTSPLPHLSTCAMSCSSGYLPVGSTTECRAGNLTQVQRCDANACPVTVTNGTPGTCAQPNIASGTSCSITCNSGYTLQGTQTCAPQAR